MSTDSNQLGSFLPAESSGLLALSAAIRESAVAHGRILIVDASPERGHKLGRMLDNVEYELLEAATTSEAIGAISANRVDLVLLDVAAPELGAAGFCRALRKASATRFIPIFVTAESQDLEAEVEAIEAGADQFLVAPFHPGAFRARVHASLRHKVMVDTLDDSETVLFSLARSVDERDPDLSLHCQRLALLGATLGAALNLPARDILALERGGYLHDIGKISIPDRILFKAGPLTPEEWDVMKTHAERGEGICKPIKSLADVLPIIRNHHERWDGSGYPDGLRGEEIPLLARILQLADIYDSLTAVRPYKRAFTAEKAISIIWEETDKGWRDPALVKTFVEILPMFRTPVPPEFSGISLQLLAAAIGRHGAAPDRDLTTQPVSEHVSQSATQPGAKTLDFLKQISSAG
jgi:putative two-component system response regulator